MASRENPQTFPRPLFTPILHKVKIVNMPTAHVTDSPSPWRNPVMSSLEKQPVLLLGLYRGGRMGKRENKAVDRDLN